MPSPHGAESRLGIVVPVRAIGEGERATLAALALAAPSLEFVAAGDLARGAAGGAAGLPPNLTLVDFRGGLYAAMNAGLARARSDYLLFMGIDDRLLAENAVAAAARLARLPRTALVALPYLFNGRQYRLRPGATWPRAFHHQGVLFERQSALRLGGYDERYRLHADLDLMFRMQGAGPAGWIDLPLVEFRVGGVTTTGEHSIASIREINRIYRTHGVSRVDRMFFFSVVNLGGYWLARRLRGERAR